VLSKTPKPEIGEELESELTVRFEELLRSEGWATTCGRRFQKIERLSRISLR